MRKSFWILGRARGQNAFTLVELLVAMTLLVLMVGFISQLTNGVSSIIGGGEAHIDTDGQARALLDRMAIDIGAMVKRPDVDYYLKGRPTSLTQPGNDQMAFYSYVPGYFPTSAGATAQSSASLIAYRVNGMTFHMERLSKGLAWNGASATAGYSMGFLPLPLASPLPSAPPSASPTPLPYPTPPTTAPSPLWPQAADPNQQDLDYEELAPQVFRFEYYYVLKGQSSTDAASVLSLTPWYMNSPVNHTSVNGMQDVAGIVVLIAVIDPKSRQLLSTAQLTTLIGLMEDAPAPGSGTPLFTSAGAIQTQWAAAVVRAGQNNPGQTSTIPLAAAQGIRIYSRCFYLNGVSP